MLEKIFNFLTILIIRLIDLPILENNPFIYSWIKWKFLLDAPIYSVEGRDQIEREQFADELEYTHIVGLYEYNIFLKFFDLLKNKFIGGNLLLAFLLILTLLYNWRENLVFLFSSVMLPISFYYLCVLMDYYEAIEELLKHIKNILSIYS